MEGQRIRWRGGREDYLTEATVSLHTSAIEMECVGDGTAAYIVFFDGGGGDGMRR